MRSGRLPGDTVRPPPAARAEVARIPPLRDHLMQRQRLLLSSTLVAGCILAQGLVAPALAQGSQGDGAVSERRFDGAFEPADGFGSRPPDGLLAFCAAIPSSVPARIAAGASGKLIVVLSLKGQAVFPAGARMRLDYATEQHGVRLGRWTISTARPGKRAGAFRGVPVHEDTATIEIPITVDPGAAAGAHAVVLTLDADVHDAATGQRICAAQMPIHAVVTSSTAVSRATAATSPDLAAAPTTSSPPTPPVGSDGAREGAITEAVGESTGGASPGVGDVARPSGAPPSSVSSDRDTDWLLFATVGLLLLGIVMLVVRRARGGGA
jgi:hypothetical protein